MIWDMEHKWRLLCEKLTMWVAWHLPRVLVMWASVRLIANATQGRWSGEDCAGVKAMDALKRWEEQ